MDKILLESAKYKRKYKCPYCDKKLDRQALVRHVEKYHEDMIPEGYTPSRIVFNTVNNKDHGTCVVCGKEAPWNEEKCRYDRLCGSDECKKKYKEMTEERIKRTHNGKTSRDLLLDPEQQNKMLAGRSISGTYKWSDGDKKSYVGSYELKALECMDKILHCNSEDVITPGPTIPYEYNGEKHFWITDIYYEPYNLAIDCKDGGDNPNNRPMPDYRAKQDAKEAAIKKQGIYNYLRLTDNNFHQLFNTMAELKLRFVEDDKQEDKLIRIYENMSIASINTIVPTCGRNSVYVVNYMKNGKMEQGVTKDITLDSIFVQDGDEIKKETKSYLEGCKYSIYYLCREGVSEKLEKILHAKNVPPHYIYETLFDKKYYTDDQILAEHMLEVIDYDQYNKLMSEAVQSITEATLRPSSGISVPTAKVFKDDNIVELRDNDGYYIRNTKTGLRTKSRSKSEYTGMEQLFIKGGIL